MSHSYVPVEALRDYLDQATDASSDKLHDILVRATSIVETELQKGQNKDIAFTGYETGIKLIPNILRVSHLVVPAHQQGTIVWLADEQFNEVPAESISRGDDGIIQKIEGWRYATSQQLFLKNGWRADVLYSIEADWGYGFPSASIQQVVLELAVNIWRSADRAMYQEMIGPQGGGYLEYVGGLTKQQAMIINHARKRFEVVSL